MKRGVETEEKYDILKILNDLKTKGVKGLNYDILNRWNDRELLNICSVSKEASKLCNDQEFWKIRTYKKFGNYLSSDLINFYKGDRKWSDYYIELSSKLNSKHANYELAKAMEFNRQDLQILLKQINGADVIFNDEEFTKYYTGAYDNKYQGKFRSYLEGKLLIEGDYIDGKKFGEWIEYYPNGQIEKIRNYK